MSIANAFFVTLAFLGACSLAYLFGSFWTFNQRHRRIRRNSWPNHGHTDHFFRDLKDWPEQ